MGRVLRAVLYAVGGGIALGAIAFIAGFVLAGILGESGQALGMIVPMVIVPAAILIGAVVGGIKGYRQA